MPREARRRAKDKEPCLVCCAPRLGKCCGAGVRRWREEVERGGGERRWRETHRAVLVPRPILIDSENPSKLGSITLGSAVIKTS